MADAAVDFLLEKLQHLQYYQSHLISDVNKQVENVVKNLHIFKVFLDDSAKKRRRKDDDHLRQLVRQIRDVVYEAEDIIDALVTQAAHSKSKSYFSRAFDAPTKLLSIIEDIETIGAKIGEVYSNKALIESADLAVDGGRPNSEVPLLRQDNVVGFEDGAKTIIGFLLEKTQRLDVISIVGMSGLGKTTLAKKIFNDPVIRYKFPVCIWIYISKEFTKKDVFLSILREFTKIDENMYDKSDQELAQLVVAHLERGKFLIVMDDVWTVEDWNTLQIAMPKGNTKGKVLITSRHVEVAHHANQDRFPHHLCPLTKDESLLLLQYEVFGKAECPPELEDLGKLIAEKCCGLPLAIVVIGGILLKEFSAPHDMIATRNAWTKVFESINDLNEDPERCMKKIIALSYDELPYHLRACFLYLGIFPKDFEIPFWKLLHMWIAEGFIQKESGINLEETAENYLEDLINRNLLRVDKRRSDGGVKTCRIHDMLRDFCKNEAGSEIENFLQEVMRHNDGFEPPITDVENFRRLCIHTDVLDFLSSQPYGPHIRSFVCFSKEKVTLEGGNILTIPKVFKLLKVLEARPIKFARIPSDLYHLFHLRYITLSFNLASLPKYFSKFWYIQTLVVYTTSRTLEVKADIWNMIQLRHFKTNASATLPEIGQSSKASGQLQTLGRISPQNCTKEVFERVQNLKKLGIRGELALLLDDEYRLFGNLVKLEELVQLKLENDVFPSPPSIHQLQSLPPSSKFPPNLKSLTLSYTFLDWSHISILGLLENLNVLKLKEKAFMGDYWEVTGGGFYRLEFLHIGRTNLVTWVASSYQFPKLKCLEMHNCEELQQIPIGLADVPSFRVLDLYRSKYAIASAKKIREAKKKQIKQTIKVEVFKLSIFPPDDDHRDSNVFSTDITH
ncbi:putative late blight resistance proteinR1C-3 [Sesamum alatum]|uniref:Late blight resistance proteinR1C-3 n=1 Tax=Sesamum alatum TaxID=300844 RepID=A0AAE1YK33_9LAMI|nr:putative late blight resistance proteinR1C-3 [Sesamum alatum]